MEQNISSRKKRCDLKPVSQFDDGIGHRGCRCKIQDRTMDLKATAFANKRGSAYGYSVLNGEEIPEELIKVIRLSEFSGSEHEIILASDGYPVLKPTLQQSEWELEYIMREDPQCCRMYESTKGLKSGNKSFDDRTYIRFQIEA